MQTLVVSEDKLVTCSSSHLSAWPVKPPGSKWDLRTAVKELTVEPDRCYQVVGSRVCGTKWEIGDRREVEGRVYIVAKTTVTWQRSFANVGNAWRKTVTVKIGKRKLNGQGLRPRGRRPKARGSAATVSHYVMRLRNVSKLRKRLRNGSGYYVSDYVIDNRMT